MSTSSPATDHGHCLCKAITFTLTGPPLYTVICHCSNCRRQGGSTLHCASIYLLTQYKMHTGHDAVTTYVDTDTQSGKPLYRTFCKFCGSKVSARTGLNEAIISIPAGVLDKVAEWRPMKEQFCGGRAGWVPEVEGVEERSEMGPGGNVVKGLSKL